MGRARALLIVAAIGLLVGASSARAQGTDYPSGVINVPPDGLDFPQGTIVKVGPNTTFTGSGEIRIYGTVIVKAVPTGPVIFTVPVTVYAGGRFDTEGAQFLTVKNASVDVNGGRASFANASFTGNDGAIYARGAAVVSVAGARFSNNTGDAVRVEGDASISIARAEFLGNGRGASVYSASSFVLRDSSFADNGQHLFIELGPWSTKGDITLSGDRFGAPASTSAQLPGILLRDASAVANAPSRIRLESDRIEEAPVGIRAEGSGLVVESGNDTIVNNTIGLSVQQATVHLSGATLGNDRDVDGSGRVTLDAVTYLRQGTTSAAQVADGAAWGPWAVVGAVLAVGVVAILVIPRLVKRAPPPPPSPPPPPPPPAERQPDLPPLAPIALTAVERRILQDIAANPGTAQRAVADRLGTTRQALHYHVKKLEARGLILKSVEGRETRCTLPPQALQILATQTESQEKG